MEGIKRNIPNIITLGNMFCGMLAILFVTQNQLAFASILIFCGAIFDFLDGLFARLLNSTSNFGKQLDSLADMVTFGIAPGVILVHVIWSMQLAEAYGGSPLFPDYLSNTSVLHMIPALDPYVLDNWIPATWISFSALLIPIASSIRLARFNVDSTDDNYFIGLPTPACAIFIASIPMIMYHHPDYLINSKSLAIISVILSLLLIAKIRIFSFKMYNEFHIKSKLNIIRILFLIISIILLFLFQFVAIPFIVVLHVFLSIINNLTT